MGGRVVTLGVWFVLTPFLLHHLGPVEYGLWVLVGALVGYGTILDLGISSAVAKYVAEYRARGEIEKARALVATALSLYTALGLLAVALAAALSPVFPRVFNIPASEHHRAALLVLVSGLVVGVELPASTSYSVLRGLQRFDVINLINVVGMLLLALVTVIVILLGGGLIGIVAANIPLTLLMQIPTVWFIRRTAPDLPVGWRGFDLRLVRPVASFSSALFLTSIAGQLKAKTDELVIGAFLPVARVTPYALARRLSELPQILTSQFIRILLPLASQLHAERDRARLRALFTTSTRASLALFLPIACGVAVLAGPFLAAWVGPAYAHNGRLVLILVVAGLVEISVWPAAAILQGMARHRLLAVFSAGSALANLGLSIVLVRPLGVTGVALGTLIATGGEMFFFVFPFALRVAGVDVRSALKQVLVPTLVPAVPAVVALYGMREALRPASLVSVAFAGLAGALVYLATYLAFEASRPERETLRVAGLGVLGFLRARATAAVVSARRS